MLDIINVRIWNREAGRLVEIRDGWKKKILFFFNDEFLKDGWNIAPLRAPLATNRGLPVFPDQGKMFSGLPSFIADSLPDLWGNTVFNEWAMREGVKSKDLSAIDRLAYIGKRGMGALEFAPPTRPDLETPFSLRISDLCEMADKVLTRAKGLNVSPSPDMMIESLYTVGTSAGGRRPKAVVNMDPDTLECYSGQVAPPSSKFVPVIVKFDEHSGVPSTRIEYSYWLMARKAGLNMTRSFLIEGERDAHFVTERFDRTPSGDKLHTQTLAAVWPSADSYEALFSAACRIGVPPREMDNAYLSMAMNVACGNVDDHSKNFGFLMGRDGAWHLAPSYDFTFSVDASAPGYVNRHSMTVRGKNEEITRGDLLNFADDYNIRNGEGMLNVAVEAADAYCDFGKKAGVPDEWIVKIEGEIAARSRNLKP